LLDACAVFEAFSARGWRALCTQYEVLIPETVAFREAYYYEDDEGTKHDLDMKQFAADGMFKLVAAPTTSIEDMRKRLHPGLRQKVDAGEAEAIAYLRTLGDLEHIRFVTADGGAIEALVAFDMGEAAMSLDAALRACGAPRVLPAHHQETFVEKKRQDGMQLKLSGKARVDVTFDGKPIAPPKEKKGKSKR
jgi:hypothetical protein